MHKHKIEVMLCLGEDVGGKRVDGPDLVLSAICRLGKDPDGCSEEAHAGLISGLSSRLELY